MAEQWFAGKINLRATTRARYKSALRIHVMPRWGDIRLDRVEHGDIQRWLAGLASNGQSGASFAKLTAYSFRSTSPSGTTPRHQPQQRRQPAPLNCETVATSPLSNSISSPATHALAGSSARPRVLRAAVVNWPASASATSISYADGSTSSALSPSQRWPTRVEQPKNHERDPCRSPRIVFTRAAPCPCTRRRPGRPVMSLLRTDPPRGQPGTPTRRHRRQHLARLGPVHHRLGFYGSIHHGDRETAMGRSNTSSPSSPPACAMCASGGFLVDDLGGRREPDIVIGRAAASLSAIRGLLSRSTTASAPSPPARIVICPRPW